MKACLLYRAKHKRENDYETEESCVVTSWEAPGHKKGRFYNAIASVPLVHISIQSD